MNEAVIHELTERLRALEDKAAIRDRWQDYLYSLDAFRWDNLRDIFTTDGTLEIAGLDQLQSGVDRTYYGRDEIVAFYQRFMTEVCAKEKGLHFTGHHGTNIKIDVSGDEARTLACFFDISGTNTIISGTYKHLFVRGTDEWRIKYLQVAIRYTGRIDVSDVVGFSLSEVLALPNP